MAYEPECAALPDHPGLVASPQLRSTFDIAWTCLSVVLLCTWAVLHLNVPAETVKLDYRRTIYLAGRQVWWWLVALFSPEIIVSGCTMKLLAARKLKLSIGNAAKADGVPWTLSHAFFAAMGGFAVTFDDMNDDRLDRDSDEKPGKPHPHASDARVLLITTTPTPSSTTTPTDLAEAKRANLRREIGSIQSKHGVPLSHTVLQKLITEMPWKEHDAHGELVREVLNEIEPEHLKTHTPKSYYDEVMALRGNIWVLHGRQLLQAHDLGIIGKLPNVTEAEIEDRSKADIMTKVIALLQTSWFIAELLLRTAQRLPIAQIEIHTAALVACSTIAYFVDWHRPQGTMTRIKIPAIRPATADDIRSIASMGGSPQWFRRSPTHISNGNIHDCGIKFGRGQNTSRTKPLEEILPIHIAGVSFALVFAAVHFSAWNYEFPTPQEQFGWRIACLVMVALPVPISGMMLHSQYLEKRDLATRLLAALEGYTVLLLEGFYVLARLFILAEVVRTLFYLPAKAYDATVLWNLPHVG